MDAPLRPASYDASERHDGAIEEVIRPHETGPFELEFSASSSPGWEERKTMKASKFSEAQKAFILKQGADGVPVAEICRKAGSARRPTSTGRRSMTA